MKKVIFLSMFFGLSGITLTLFARTINESLYRAAGAGDYKWVKRLVEKKHADINWRNSRCKTPLIKTCERGHARVAQYLLLKKNKAGKRYVYYNAADDKGETALHKAARKGKPLVVKMLLQAGADRCRVNKDCLTALDMAEDKHRKKVIALFKKKIKTIDQIEWEREEKKKAQEKAKKEKAKDKQTLRQASLARVGTQQDDREKKKESEKKEKKIKKRFKRLRGKEVKLPQKKKKKIAQ